MILVIHKTLENTINIYTCFRNKSEKGGYNMVYNRVYYCSGGGKESGNDKATNQNANSDKQTKSTKK